MRTRLIPSTFACVLALAAPAFGALAACGGASDQEIREAQTSGYKGDFAVIYSETLAAVRELYPMVGEELRTGMINTAWHPVHVQQGTEEEPQQNPTPGQPRSGLPTTTVQREQFFIRVHVHVVGGKPWRVRVRGEASSWKAGDAIPTVLRGPETPHWLEGRVNALEVAIHKRLKKYAVGLEFRPRPAAKAEAKPLDVARFGQVPPGAARVIAEVERAAGARDVTRLRSFMADAFTYSTGDEPSADTAVVVWQADPSILAELVKALDAGCAHDRAGAQVVCPAASLADAGFSGYRAGFKEAGGSWKMVSFVAGD